MIRANCRRTIGLAKMIMELRQAGVTDPQVLSALETTPRDVFIPAEGEAEAYANHALPIGCGQTISQPVVVGLMTQALALGPNSKVLEIGTGSGYQTTILSKLCRRVYTLERHRDLHVAAEKRFARLGLRNVVARFGDGWKGWPEQALFHRIIVTAAPREAPERLLSQLGASGIMVIPIGSEFNDQKLLKIVKNADDDQVTIRELFPVRFVPMVRGLASNRH